MSDLKRDAASGREYEEWKGWVLWRGETNYAVTWSADDGDRNPDWYTAQAVKPRQEFGIGRGKQYWSDAQVRMAGYGSMDVRIAELLAELLARAISEATKMNAEKGVLA